MTWKAHIAFALCFMLAVGIYYQYGGPVDTRLLSKYKEPRYTVGQKFERLESGSSSRRRAYKYAPRVTRTQKSTYERVKDTIGFLADIVTIVTPAVVLITWAVTFFRRRRAIA